jgi:hypothetical protein
MLNSKVPTCKSVRAQCMNENCVLSLLHGIHRISGCTVLRRVTRRLVLAANSCTSRFYEKSSLGEFIKRQNQFRSCKIELPGGTCYEINCCANIAPLFPSGLRLCGNSHRQHTDRTNWIRRISRIG